MLSVVRGKESITGEGEKGEKECEAGLTSLSNAIESRAWRGVGS